MTTSTQEIEIIAPDPGVQTEVCQSDVYELLVGGAVGGGKAQPLDALVMTPFGFKTMGEMRVGSQVSNPDGSVATVIQVHPQGEKDIYRVSFQDGTSCEVCADHLWLVRFSQRTLKADRRYLDTGESVRGRLITTAELMKYLDKLDGFAVNARPITPLTKPVVFTKAYRTPQITVDPYVLGVLIGDGCLVGGNNITFTSLDQEIVDQVSAKYEVSSRSDGKTYGIVKSPELLQILKDWGLFGQKSSGKFVPEPYKTASVEDRLALVQGLMDTDGYVDDRGHCSYTTVSDQQATDAQFILESLGYRITRTIDTNTGYRDADGEFIKCQDAFTLYIQGPNCERLIRLPRKKDRCKPFNGGKENDVVGRAIVKIEFSRRAEAQCITVDHPNGLYLTNNFIVTHNSFLIVFEAMRQVQYSDYRAVIFRRSLGELKDMLEMAQGIYLSAYPGTKYNISERKFKFPSGATVTFSFAENMEDALRWRGREYSFLAIDELGDFDWDVYEFLKTRVRYGGKHKDMKRYIRVTCNPEGRSYYDIKQYFIDPAPPRTRIIDRRTGEDRMFIPVKMDDNSHIDAGYKARLSYLPAKRYKALVEGEWNVWSGEVFDLKKGVHIWSWEEFYERNGIKEEDRNGIPKNWVRMMGCDWGYAVPFCFAWVATDTKGRMYVYREYMGCSRDTQGRINFNDGLRLTYEEAAAEVKKMEKDEMIHFRVIDPAERAKMRGDRAPLDAWGAPIQGPTGIELFAKEGLFFLPGDNQRINGIREVHRRLHYEVDKAGLIQDYPYLIFIEEETPLLQATFLALESDPKNPEDILNERNVSDHCLVAGTMVKVVGGEKPIEEVKVGEEVLTRVGFKPVMRSGMTKEIADIYELVTTSGIRIRGTDNHPVYVQGKGFIPLIQLQKGDKLITCEETLKKLSLTESLSDVTPTRPTDLTSFTSDRVQPISSGGLVTYTKRFGKQPTERSQKVITSIIETRTPLTTTSLTSNVSWPSTTSLNMPWSASQTILKRPTEEYEQPKPRLLSGTAQKRVGLGTESTPEKSLITCKSKSISANTATRPISKSRLAPPSSARITVNQRLEETLELTTLQESAWFVPQNSRSTNTPKSNAVPTFAEAVAAIYPVGTASVYNLAVQDQPEFFANGILVHNSYDCIRYICMSRPLTTRVDPKEDRWLRKKNDRIPDGDSGWAVGF